MPFEKTLNPPLQEILDDLYTCIQMYTGSVLVLASCTQTVYGLFDHRMFQSELYLKF